MQTKLHQWARSPSGRNPWRAGCGESRTSGSEGGPEKPTGGNAGTALRSDPYTKLKGGLTLHVDRGPSMTAKTLALKLADLGLSKSHSRPYTSNDNPFSEAQFKTLKYRPAFPERFRSLEDARAFATRAWLC